MDAKDMQHSRVNLAIDIKVDIQALAIIVGAFWTLWLGLGWI
jgi:hypothetical protein